MDILETLRGIFSPAQAQPMAVPAGGPAAVPGAQTLDPKVMQVLAQFGFQPPDPAQDKRRAIASALAQAGQKLASTPGDFMDALPGAVTTGGVAYTGLRNEQAEDKRKNSMDILKQMFGLEKTAQLEEGRDRRFDERLAQTIARNKVLEEQGGDRIVIMGRNADTAGRRVDETADHNDAMEGIAGRNAKTAEERVTIAKDEAKRHAAEFKAKFDSGYFTKKGPGADGGKADSEFWRRKDLASKMKERKAKELGLDDAIRSVTDPEGWEADRKALEAYSTELDKELEQTRPSTASPPSPVQPAPGATPAPPVVKPGAGVPSKVDTSDLGLPADIASKVVKRAVKNGKTYVKLSDGRTLEIQP